MRFKETELSGAWVIEPEPIEDERGFFERSWCAEEFAAHGLECRLVQCSASYNRSKGTLRGMHYQAEPHAEAKLVRVTRGAIYDVALDLRPHSPTFKRWIAVELSLENRKLFFLPEGLAHGFQTLVDDTEVFYQMSAPYHPESARGVRWDDPAFAITWPSVERLISQRDRSFLDFQGES
ncbi:MAG: dTDP-4-dehydrorhamnose 3,5-epimerase [Gemmatimonadota bacterium]